MSAWMVCRNTTTIAPRKTGDGALVIGISQSSDEGTLPKRIWERQSPIRLVRSMISVSSGKSGLSDVAGTDIDDAMVESVFWGAKDACGAKAKQGCCKFLYVRTPNLEILNRRSRCAG